MGLFPGMSLLSTQSPDDACILLLRSKCKLANLGNECRRARESGPAALVFLRCRYRLIAEIVLQSPANVWWSSTKPSAGPRKAPGVLEAAHMGSVSTFPVVRYQKG